MLSQTFCCINTKCSSKSQHGRRPLPPVFSFPDMHTHIHTQSHTTTAALTVYTRCHCQCRSKLSLIKCLKGAVLCKQPIRLGPHRAAVPHLLLRTLQMLYNITKYTYNCFPASHISVQHTWLWIYSWIVAKMWSAKRKITFVYKPKQGVNLISSFMLVHCDFTGHCFYDNVVISATPISQVIAAQLYGAMCLFFMLIDVFALLIGIVAEVKETGICAAFTAALVLNCNGALRSS